jgi:hypothetical protein
VSAAQVEGLFPAAAVAAPAPVVQAAPPAARPAWMPGGAAAVARPGMGGGRPGQPVAGARPVATAAVPVAQPGGPYPVFSVKSAGFGLWLGALIGAGVAFILCFVVASSMKNATPDTPPPAGTLILILVMLGLAGVCWIFAAIYQLMLLYRAWACLQPGRPRTTPGAAVGMLFIPFYNLYWIFVAWYGLAQDWNKIMARHEDLRLAPRMGEGLFLAMCICSLVFAPVGLVLLIPVVSQLCRGINFMAFRRSTQSGGLTFW